MQKIVDDIKDSFDKNKSLYYMLGVVGVGVGGLLLYRATGSSDVPQSTVTTTPKKKSMPSKVTEETVTKTVKSDIVSQKTHTFSNLGMSFTIPSSWNVDGETKEVAMLGKTVFSITIVDEKTQDKHQFTFERVGAQLTIKELTESILGQFTMHNSGLSIRVNNIKISGYECNEIVVPNTVMYALKYEDLFMLSTSNNHHFSRQILDSVKIFGTSSKGQLEYSNSRGFKMNLKPVFNQSFFHATNPEGELMSLVNGDCKLSIVETGSKVILSGMKEEETDINKEKSSIIVDSTNTRAHYYIKLGELELKLSLETKKGNATKLLVKIVESVESLKVYTSSFTYTNAFFRMQVPENSQFNEPIDEFNEPLLYMVTAVKSGVIITRCDKIELKNPLIESKEALEQQLLTGDEEGSDEKIIKSSNFIEMNGYQALQIHFEVRPTTMAREMGIDFECIPMVATMLEKLGNAYHIRSEYVSEKEMPTEDGEFFELIHTSFV
jgi:hypothetical protein